MKLINIVYKVGQRRTGNIPVKEPHISNVKIEKRNKSLKLFLICSEISHTQIPHLLANSQMNCNKTEITGFNKTQNTNEGNLKTDSSYKGN